ncbi:ABC transporter permease, partial [Patescibacteria group bacterium]|nr:ABC transporter permease [Patescibacteria group bacterium]
KNNGDVSRMYIIELAFRNLQAKKGRAIVTIGGMAVGVGAIVFLVSVGYGLERMVIDRVARLDELRMIDVGLGEAGNLRMNDELLKKIAEFDGVFEIVPSVSMVSKINFKNSVLDIMSFGVDKKYLEIVGANVIEGDEYADKDLEFSFVESEGNVAGVSQELIFAKKEEKASSGIRRFNIMEGEKIGVWKECDTDSEFLGYVIRSEGDYIGEELWGEHYYLGQGLERVAKNENTKVEYSVWMRAKVPLWISDESDVVVPFLLSNGGRKWEIGCLMEYGLMVDEMSEIEYSFKSLDEYLSGSVGEVLGESTEIASDSASVEATDSADIKDSDETEIATASADLFEAKIATDSAGVEWVELRGVGEVDEKEEEKKVEFYGMPVAEAYVSTGMLKVFGLNAKEALSESFKVSYVVSDSLVPGLSGRYDSEEVEYKIKGVVEDDNSSYYYFHLADAKRLGIKNYSQLKVIIKKRDEVAKVRNDVETLGLKTTSTLDTVEEIEKLFRNLRMLLGFLGTIALAVASLGMFNTMTVSLLERTREVGVMKSMGMLSREVKELFLAESMIMGMGGGVFGVLFGLFLGKLLSIFLSSVSILKGQGIINISYMPWFFAFFILTVSFFVGIATGWYPSKRAKQISALNALRYE